MRHHIHALRRPPAGVTGHAPCSPVWQFLLQPVVLLLLVLPLTRLSAQQIDTNQFINHFPLSDAAAPLRSTWGFNDDEFSIGALFSIWPNDTANVGQLWDVARSLGISIWEDRQVPNEHVGFYRYWDQLIDEANGRLGGRWRERVIAAGGHFTRIGHAREVIFYPFDSSQSYYWRCFWRTRIGGIDTINGEELDYKQTPSTERVYRTGVTTANQYIAERIVFGFDSLKHIRRYPKVSGDDDGCEIAGDAFAWRNDLDYSHFDGHNGDNSHDDNRTARWLYFTVSAHLFSPLNGGRPDTVGLNDSLLVIELWNERTIGQTYVGVGGIDSISTDTTAVLYKSILIRKSQLVPDATTGFNINRYRVALDSIDMISDATTGVGGPWHTTHAGDFSGNSAFRNQRFDIRVRWTGAEKLALRSIALRDTAAQLLFGTGQRSQTFRRYIIDTLSSRLLFRPLTGGGLDTVTRRERLIRYYTGDEPRATMYAGFNWLDSALYRRYPDNTQMTRGPRAWHGRNDPNMSNVLLSSDNEINIETYGATNVGSSAAQSFGLPGHIYARPALREHNGGRFQSSGSAQTKLPELVLDTNNLSTSRDSVEIYTKFFQRVSVGANNPGRTVYPWNIGTKVADLAKAAWASRRTGRRLIHWPGTMGQLPQPLPCQTIVQWSGNLVAIAHNGSYLSRRKHQCPSQSKSTSTVRELHQ